MWGLSLTAQPGIAVQIILIGTFIKACLFYFVYWPDRKHFTPTKTTAKQTWNCTPKLRSASIIRSFYTWLAARGLNIYNWKKLWRRLEWDWSLSPARQLSVAGQINTQTLSLSSARRSHCVENPAVRTSPAPSRWWTGCDFPFPPWSSFV